MHGRAHPTTAFEMDPVMLPQQVVLEVDRSRQVEFRRWLAIGCVVLAAALFDGWQRSVPVSHGYRLEEIHRSLSDEDELGRRLRLEIASLQSPATIEWLATNQLHLVAPGRDNAIVIERIVPPPAPPSSVVALR
jgi:cell division protein FtsL